MTKLIVAALAILTAASGALAQPASRLEPSIRVQGQGRVEDEPHAPLVTSNRRDELHQSSGQ